MRAPNASKQIRGAVEEIEAHGLAALTEFEFAKLGCAALCLRRAIEDETLRRLKAENGRMRKEIKAATPGAVNELSVLDALSELAALDEDTSAMDLAHRLKCSDSTARRWVNGLVKDGFLEMTDSWVQGTFKRTPATFYSLTVAGSKRLQILEAAK